MVSRNCSGKPSRRRSTSYTSYSTQNDSMDAPRSARQSYVLVSVCCSEIRLEIVKCTRPKAVWAHAAPSHFWIGGGPAADGRPLRRLLRSPHFRPTFSDRARGGHDAKTTGEPSRCGLTLWAGMCMGYRQFYVMLDCMHLCWCSRERRRLKKKKRKRRREGEKRRRLDNFSEIISHLRSYNLHTEHASSS